MVGEFLNCQVQFEYIWCYTHRVQNCHRQHVPKGEINMLSASISFISTTECGIIKMGGIHANIQLIIGGSRDKIGHHESQIASGVTNDQNMIIILIIF